MPAKNEKIKEVIKKLSAEYYSRESNRQSLITITDVEINDRSNRATILMTVLPESSENDALAFALRHLSNLRQYLVEKSRIARMPFISVQIDKGEKNRQRIDEIGKSL